MKRELAKLIWREVLQYIILITVYVIGATAISYVLELIIPNQSGELKLALDTLIIATIGFLSVATKPTPISVALFGVITYFSFGNGASGVVFFMAIFPIIYFVEKKGLYRIKKDLFLSMLFCFILLGADMIYTWVRQGSFNNEMVLVSASVVLAFLYATHKPMFIKKMFPVKEEHRASEKMALSTKIIIVFGLISIIVFAADLYTANNEQDKMNISQASHIEKRVAGEAASILRTDSFTEQAARELLELVGSNYEGIICIDVKTQNSIAAYQEDASKDLNQAVFQAYIDQILGDSGNYNKSNQELIDYGYYSVSQFYVREDTVQYNSDLQYIVFLIEYEGSAVMGNASGIEIENSFKRFFMMICMLLPTFYWFVEFMITRPINRMTSMVSKYVSSSDEQRNDFEAKYTKLDIHSGDEIENLYHAFGKTIADVNMYINDLHMKNQQINRMQFSMISTLANVVENRDENTGAHIKRTAEYVEIIGKQMGKTDKYKDILTEKYIEDMKIAAPLHDMGKIHVSDIILNKPGKLSDDEYAIMKTHTTEGKLILQKTIEEFGKFDYLSMAVEMAGSHHERYDGRGYPEGLKGEEIPLCARIMAIADVFDALVSKRSYKDPMPLSKAYSIIEEGRGTQFDPDAVDAFFAAKDEIEKVNILHFGGVQNLKCLK